MLYSPHVTSREVINVKFTAPYVTRGEFDVISKIVTRDVSQSEKTLSEVI